MCGITGYIGEKDAYPIIINGLKRLEYRGYDSARSEERRVGKEWRSRKARRQEKNKKEKE